MDYSLNICHLYPDVLNLYGDRGNIICMQKRLQWRGIEANVKDVSIGQPLNIEEHDLFFIGGGQDFEQEVLLCDLVDENKKDAITLAVEDDKVFLAICGGYQMMGSHYETWDGVRCDFVGALDLYTVGGKDRMIGNYMFTCDDIGGRAIVGFENHSGKTWLGKNARPMGKVLKGHGNNGEDGTEGARYRNVFGTYSHGPVLPKNPEFCDHLLKTALLRKYPNLTLSRLDDVFEINAHDYMAARLSG